MKRHLAPLLGLIALCVPIFMIGSSRTGFQGADELRYAQIAKELGPGRDLFLLHFNGERYSDKPPLYFWSVALSFKMFGGVSPHALRFPGMMSGVISVVLTYFLGVTLFGGVGMAFGSAFLLMLMPRFLWILRWGRLDLPMSMFVYASLLCFAINYFGKKTRLGGWGFWLFLGLAFAVKGPAGAMVIIGTAATFLIWQGEGRRWKELLHPGGMVLAIALNAVWIAPILLLGDEGSSRELIVEQNLGRIFDPWRHLRPPYYYFTNIWYNAFPAAMFVAGFGIFWWRRRNTPAPSGPGATEKVFGGAHSSCRFLLSWLLFTLIFFSILPTKRAQYLLPAYPAAAMLTVFFVAFGSRKIGSATTLLSVPRGYFRIPGCLNLGVLISVILLLWRSELVSVAANLLERFAPEQAGSLREANADFKFGVYQAARAARISGSLLLVIAMGFAFRALWRGRTIGALVLMLSILYGSYFSFFGWVVPPAFRDDEMIRFSEETAELMRENPDLEICVFGDTKPYFNIYGDYHVTYFDNDERGDFQHHVWRRHAEGRDLMVIFETEREGRFQGDPWYQDMARRELTMRGERMAVFETR